MPHFIKTTRGLFEIHKASWGWGVLNLATGHVDGFKSEAQCWEFLRSHGDEQQRHPPASPDTWKV